FIGSIVQFEDGSSWELTRALSHTKWQREQPPYEATQVFECELRCGSENNYDNNLVAVIKMKCQIRGFEQDAQDLLNLVQRLEEAQAKTPNREYISSQLEAARGLFFATHPTTYFSDDIMREIKALNHIKKMGCEHSPYSLNFCTDTVRFGIDPLEMTGGYVAFILMTKVPGEQLANDYWNRALEERDKILAAFKDALLQLPRFVYQNRIEPLNTARRNIVWDKDERKCYIVDFEDSEVLSEEAAAKADANFRVYEYRAWGLSE
ncbi:hypothetical protein K458DRAFT_256979, partial [Lentithecium fluviatile CBS 122367]